MLIKRLCFIVFILLILSGSVFSARYMEKLGRGVVAVRTSNSQVYVGWRMLGTEWGQNIGYYVYRNGIRINSSPITTSTNYTHTISTDGAYSVSAVIDGIEGELSEAVSVWNNSADDYKSYKNVPLSVPAGVTTPDGVTCTYSPNDCSVGDLDGDGEYEIVLKWDPSNSKDNASSGYTGNVYLDAYEIDGTFLWRIDLGINIRAGAHYTQFMVYDLDSDGKAEVACKTAPYTIDGQGNSVLMPGDTLADYRNSSGYILSGPEYLTIFNGQTGTAMATASYNPPRGAVSDWGDSYGNRVDRFLACVAYLDGVHPGLVMCRGYYTRAVLAAWDWRDGQLTQRWVFDTNNGYSSYRGQGNHNLSVGDVDGDGYDEIVYGSCTIDHNGNGLYTTGLGHGDAMHMSDMDLSRSGLEVWQCHEGGSGSTFRDAATGTVLINHTNSGDVGRACAAHIDSAFPGYQLWSSAAAGTYTTGNLQISTSRPAINFLAWWDGDLQRELVDVVDGNGKNPKLDKWNGNGVDRLISIYNWPTSYGCNANNSTKANPCLSGDILGDWREELIFRLSDNTGLMIMTTTATTSYRFYTFMHNPQYRLAIAWQNVAYNQPPHPSFYIGAEMATLPVPDIKYPGSGLYGDFTEDDRVDKSDLPYFLEYWLADACVKTAGFDLNDDCMINYIEFAAFAGNWAGPDTIPPSAPIGLAATANNGVVILNWNDNSEGDLGGYNIYRSITSGGDYIKINTSLVSNSDYTDFDVVNGTTYYYAVTAVDVLFNESSASAEVSVKPDVITSVTIQEDSTGFVYVEGTVDSNNAGFTGAGFANTTNSIEAYIEWSVTAPDTGIYDLKWRYANGGTTDRTGQVSINNTVQITGISFPATGSWTSWTESSVVSVTLSQGGNNIRLAAETANGLANIDWIEITGLSPIPGDQ